MTRQRITDKHLDGCCETLNLLLGRPVAPWQDGQSQAGCIHIDSSYGCVGIAEMTGNGGGTRSLACGLSKREAWEWLCACIRGVQMAQESNA